MPLFLQKYGFENAKKSLRLFLRFLIVVRLQGLFLKISQQGDVLFSLSPVSVELAMLPACPSLSTTCAVKKQQNAPKSAGGARLAGTPSRGNNRKKQKQISWRCSAPGMELIYGVIGLHQLHDMVPEFAL